MLFENKTKFFICFCILYFKTSGACKRDQKVDNVITCVSLDKFLNEGDQFEWTDLVIRNKERKPKQILMNDGFKNVPNLKTLIIDGSINGFEEFPFRGLHKLESLILENNEIKILPESNVFSRLNIKRLEIKSSGLEAIPTNYFRKMKNLEELHLTKNAIASVGDCAFCDLNNTVVALSHNLLNSFNAHKILGTTSLIEGIELDNNNLTQVSRFGQMFNLRGAKFSNNIITDIDDEAFLNSPRLMLLDLSYNNISDIPVTALPEIIRSDEKFVLEINTNHLDCLNEEFRNKFTALRKITMDGNPWDCECLEEMKKWAEDLNGTLGCEISETCSISCNESTEDQKKKKSD